MLPSQVSHQCGLFSELIKDLVGCPIIHIGLRYRPCGILSVF
ncbi:MAG: hypothetical protein ACTSUT_02605 [Promethearchaeota archaeon]